MAPDAPAEGNYNKWMARAPQAGVVRLVNDVGPENALLM